MSGGHYDYLYTHINELADRIEKDQRRSKEGPDEWGNKHELTEDEYLMMELFRHSLITTSDVAKELEWFMSGDTDSKYFIEKVKEMFND